MTGLGNRIAKKRKDLGMTQLEFAEKMHVTRQTVSRWEAGAVLPDIEKIGDIAGILGVSCDYLLKDGAGEENAATGSSSSETAGEDPLQGEKAGGSAAPAAGVGRLLQSLQGQTVRLQFFDGESDIDLYDTPCRIVEFEGSWMKIEADLKKSRIEKLIPVSSVLSIELVEGGK